MLAFVRRLPDHSLLDRLIRGRAWIPVLGVMLAGIVAMQVEVLKLGATMGRAIERGTALQSRNELLRASVASLQDEQRIMRLAGRRGMVMPSPGGVGFLRAREGNAAKAASGIKTPDAAAFSSLLTANGMVTTDPLPAASSTTAAPVTSTTPTTSASSVTATGSATSATGAAATDPSAATTASTATAPTTPTTATPGLASAGAAGATGTVTGG